MNKLAALCVGLAITVISCLPARAQEPEKRDVSVAIGTWVIGYLPLPVAIAKGFFKDEGLNVAMQNFNAGGSKALQALIGGSSETVVGYYDHTIQMQMQKKAIRCVVLLNNLPGNMLAVRKDLADQIHSPGDLKGRRIGVTALGSSTEFLLRYMLQRGGLSADAVTIVAVGADVTSIAAVEHKAVDALMTTDPATTLMEQRGLIAPLVDSRTYAGSTQAFGGPYPTSCLYAQQSFIDRYPHLIQHLVNAFVRSLHWIQDTPPQEIAASLPAEYELGNRSLFETVVRQDLPIFSKDGRFDPDDLARVLTVFRTFDPKARAATIDLNATYTNAFVDHVAKSGQ